MKFLKKDTVLINYKNPYNSYNRVAYATYGSPFATLLQNAVSPFIDQLPIWLSGHGSTTSEDPHAEGTRRVFGNPKLRFVFPQTPVLVLLNVPLYSTTKRQND